MLVGEVEDFAPLTVNCGPRCGGGLDVKCSLDSEGGLHVEVMT